MNTVYEEPGVRRSADATNAYPVSVEFPYPERSSMLYAIPVVGFVLKFVMLIPFFIALWIVSLIVTVAQLVLWIPVLFSGTYPEVGYTLIGGYLRWSTRVGGFFVGISDKYPSFSFADEPGSEDPVVTIQRQQTMGRGWAIPIVGLMARLVCAVPHFVVLGALQYACWFFMLVSWIPVLVNGRYAKTPYDLYTGTIRWHVRVYAYVFGLTDQYPPFSMI